MKRFTSEELVLTFGAADDPDKTTKTCRTCPPVTGKTCKTCPKPKPKPSRMETRRELGALKRQMAEVLAR